jgi:hypothetical protein
LPGRLGELARALLLRLERLERLERLKRFMHLERWKRVSWNKVGIALSATIILVSGLVLSYRLRDLDWRAVATAAAAVPLAHVAGAAFFVACG